MSRILDFSDGFTTETPTTTVVAPATSVAVTPTGNVTSTNVQSALVEIQGHVDTNTANIATNTSNIVTNTSNIASNTSAIATKATSANPVLTGTLDASAATTSNVSTSNTASTVAIGTGSGANTINIGGAASTIILSGTTITENATNMAVKDKLITINKGGAASTGAGTGFEIEENGSITGSLKTSGDRNGFEFKAPNTAGVVTLTTGATTDTVALVAGTQTLLNKTLTSPVINTPTGIVKGDVGLSNVDNTSDATKNSATATLTNKTLTAPTLTSPTLTGTVTLPATLTSGSATVTLPSATGTLATLAGTETLTNKTLNYPVISQPTGIVPADIGLNLVNNTSDSNKPVSGPQQTALNLKANSLNPTLTGPTIDVISATEQSSTPTAPSSGTRKMYVKNDGKAYLLDSTGTETALGSGSGQGGVNYIANPDAEINTTGWATYKNTAQTNPTTGTGGAPSVTWTRSTSAALRGGASFLLSKGGSNLQGEGVSYDFTIANADRGKVLACSFAYNVASGTYADDDVQMWIYDVTNAVLIQPAPFKIKNTGLAASFSAEKMFCEFQTSTSSTSYRLILHVASVSSVIYTLKFDDFLLGPQTKLYGSATTDWVAYTPTTQGFGTLGSSSVYWRHLGDSVQIAGVFTAGTQAAVEARIGLPSGMTIDATKLSSLRRVGDVTTNTATAYQVHMLAQPGVTYLNMGRSLNTATGTNLMNENDVFATGAVVTFDAIVPIAGWSSSQIMSNDADTRVVAFTASAISGSLTNSFTNISTWTQGVYDSHVAFSGGTTYTVVVPGIYDVNASITNNYNSTDCVIGVQISQNGTGVATGWADVRTGAGGCPTASATKVLNCKAGDTITIQGYSSGSSDTLSSVVGRSNFNIKRLSGPAQIAASESVQASYYVSAATFTASNTVPVNFDGKSFDSHGAVTVSATAWRFTAPISGSYRFDVLIDNNAANTAFFYAFKNGVQSRRVAVNHSSASGYGWTNPATIKLLAGDYVDIRTDTSQVVRGGTETGSNTSRIDIARTGNY